ncbi:MAG: hypothetical protein WBB00_17645 [Mycobacterium sp.]|jgi:hypothetical protein|nr:hypothetical protein [Mycobacterium sp. MBM]
MRHKRIVLLAATILVAGCGGDGPSGSLPGFPSAAEVVESAIAGTGCVDSAGSNSTPEQIADAWLSIRLPSPYTGDLRTQDEDHLAMSGPEEFLPSKNRDYLISTFYDRVPNGGDSAFASAVCDLEKGWADAYIWDHGITTDAAAEIMAKTPHFIRGLGRHVCWAMPGGGANNTIAPITLSARARSIEDIRSNPKKWKSQVIATADSVYDGIAIESPASRQAFESHQATRRNEMNNTPPEAFVTAAEQYYKLLVAAHTHQCPELNAE